MLRPHGLPFHHKVVRSEPLCICLTLIQIALAGINSLQPHMIAPHRTIYDIYMHAKTTGWDYSLFLVYRRTDSGTNDGARKKGM